MEDTHCVVPRLDVPLPAECSCSAADSQLPAPLVRASSELSPTSSLLNFQDSPAPRPEDAPPTVSSPVTPASSPGHDPPPALMGIRSRLPSASGVRQQELMSVPSIPARHIPITSKPSVQLQLSQVESRCDALTRRPERASRYSSSWAWRAVDRFR